MSEEQKIGLNPDNKNEFRGNGGEGGEKVEGVSGNKATQVVYKENSIKCVKLNEERRKGFSFSIFSFFPRLCGVFRPCWAGLLQTALRSTRGEAHVLKGERITYCTNFFAQLSIRLDWQKRAPSLLNAFFAIARWLDPRKVEDGP